MGVRGECSPAGELPPRPLFEKGFTARAAGPEVAGFKDPRLAEDPGRQGGWGSLHVPAGLGESLGKAECDLETRTRFGGSRKRRAAMRVKW